MPQSVTQTDLQNLDYLLFGSISSALSFDLPFADLTHKDNSRQSLHHFLYPIRVCPSHDQSACRYISACRGDQSKPVLSCNDILKDISALIY